MKTLLLVRHAKSSWVEDGISDLDRPLKKSGINNAIAVSKKLKMLKISTDIIITSPAIRAISTSLIFARNLKCGYDKIKISDLAYDFSKVALLPLLQGIDDKYNTAMLVGHDPALTYLLNDLTVNNFEKTPTSAVVKITFNINSWQKIANGKGKFVFIESPEKTKLKENNETGKRISKPRNKLALVQ